VESLHIEDCVTIVARVKLGCGSTWTSLLFGWTSSSSSSKQRQSGRVLLFNQKSLQSSVKLPLRGLKLAVPG
jgi:hypothetical protein